MLHCRNESFGSFRSGKLDVLASGAPGKGSGGDTRRKLAERERERIDPKRDPAFHNRVLFAGADR